MITVVSNPYSLSTDFIWTIAILMPSFTVMSKKLVMQLTKTFKTGLQKKSLFWTLHVCCTEGKN